MVFAPAGLRRLCQPNQEMYGLPFLPRWLERCWSWDTTPERLGAHLGITAVLHTWTRELDYHLHHRIRDRQVWPRTAVLLCTALPGTCFRCR